MNRSAREVPGVADELVGCEALRLWRCGAPTENLAHSVSFQSDERTAPTQPVTKHLVPKQTIAPEERSSGATVGASPAAPWVVPPRQTPQPPANGIVWP